MENIILKKVEKLIVDCHHFTSKKNGKSYFSVDYIVNRKNGDSWEKEVQFDIFDHSILPASFDKKSDEEICQELKGKSLVIERKISF